MCFIIILNFMALVHCVHQISENKVVWFLFCMFTESGRRSPKSVSITRLRVVYNFELCCGDVVCLGTQFLFLSALL